MNGHSGPPHRPRFSPAQLARMLGIDEPTSEQSAIIAAPLSPLAVIAGAGSGKSETMAARLVWLVANGYVRPERVLGLTFTRKAAAELASRVTARLDGLRRIGLVHASAVPRVASGGAVAGGGEPAVPGVLASDPGLAGEPIVSTYHSYAGRLIADHALREAIEPTVRLVTPAVAWQLAARVVARYDGPMDAVGWSPLTVTSAVLDLAGELAEHLRSADDLLTAGERLRRQLLDLPEGKRKQANAIVKTQLVREQLLPLVRAYSAAKAVREEIDYGDQMALAARIAIGHPEVGAAERAKFEVVVLDEFQDTSHAQLELLRALFGGGHPVTAVGDPCQSIYGWRGASAGNMKRFADYFPRSGNGDSHSRRASVTLLSTSFRNAGRVLDAAAAIQRDLREIAPEVPTLVAPPSRCDRGTVACALLRTSTHEANWVAGQVVRLLALPDGLAPDGRPWPDGRSDPVRPSDIAVLCRKRAQFTPLRAALEAAGIPVEVVGLGGLLTVPEVADIVATLRVLHSPSASDALARILTSPRWRIGPRDLVALGVRARELAAAGNGESAPAASPDFLDAAVADFTAETGSLVEALDDLGQALAYSTAGYSRMSELASELRALRRHVGRPLPELVAEVERALGLDVEVASIPGTDPLSARADLDAFADAAAAFAGDAQEPTLGAFLAYLTAAESEEFGLEAGQVSETDSVKLATVHSAKGLQWPVVFVPGLSAGDKSRIFPARPRLSSRWTDNPRLLPFWLRGDASDLPALAGLDPASVSEFRQDCADRDMAEERRLAYVAVTRAAYWLGCSGYWWGSGKSPLGPSPFLAEIRSACEAGAGTAEIWADPPEPGTPNPVLAVPLTASWPGQEGADSARSAAVGEAAAMVRAAMEGRHAPRPPDPEQLPDPYAGLAAEWARDAGLLVAERARHRPESIIPVALPGRIGVSALVRLAKDPDGLAASIRRPMPEPPAPRAQRGTAFHRWLEERFGPARLIAPDDLSGADDADLVASDADLAALREAFEAGEWSERFPVQVEVPFETKIGNHLVRGRIDAVFADSPDGGFDVVDWKTGRPPRPGPEERAVAVQLAAYRLAWATLAGVPVGQVRAAFYYVRDNRTVRPADLLDADGLAALVNLPDIL